MSNSNQKNCIVCQEKNAKYRCPKCVQRYCKKDCYVVHECDRMQEKLKNKKQQKIEEKEEQKEMLYKQNFVVDDDLRVSNTQLEALWNNEKIIKTLQSKKLQQQLIDIDDAQSRLRTLNQELNTDNHFMDFIDEVLTAMGLMKDKVFLGQNKV